jgi:hypothetical protein
MAFFYVKEYVLCSLYLFLEVMALQKLRRNTVKFSQKDLFEIEKFSLDLAGRKIAKRSCSPLLPSSSVAEFSLDLAVREMAKRQLLDHSSLQALVFRACYF